MSTLSPLGRQGRHASFGADLEPLSQRALQAAGVLSLLLILVVVNSLLNGGTESPFNPNPVAAAAERTAEVPGMRMRLTMRMETESSPPVTVTGKGVYNGESNLAEISYEGATPQGQRLTFDAILGDEGWFFRYPQLAAKMPEGKEWLKLEGFPGQKDLSAPGVASPDESLGMLRGAGAVERLGQARIGPATTTRYRVTQTPAEIAQVLRSEGKDELAEALESASSQLIGPIHSEVFIGGDGMMRRMRMRSTSLADGKQVTTEMRMDFSDFGIKPDIQVPDDSRVYDLTPLLEEKLEGLGEAS
ncbi:MAG TPA: hypothetical protein VFL77_01085 [Solirubrobacterales bacterium]|nr:hypothetical protein [Solirubrobacterales bacterium]